MTSHHRVLSDHEVPSAQDYTFRPVNQSQLQEHSALLNDQGRVRGRLHALPNGLEDNLLSIKRPTSQRRPSVDHSKHQSTANEKASDGFHQRYLMKCDNEQDTADRRHSTSLRSGHALRFSQPSNAKENDRPICSNDHQLQWYKDTILRLERKVYDQEN